MADKAMAAPVSQSHNYLKVFASTSSRDGTATSSVVSSTTAQIVEANTNSPNVTATTTIQIQTTTVTADQMETNPQLQTNQDT